MDVSFIVFSAFSSACSFSIILTGLMFPDMRKRLFMKIIFYIALSSCIANATSAFGLVRDAHSSLCATQSFVTIWLYKSSWLWSTALCYHLYCIVFHGHYNPRPIVMGCICWLLPLIASLLPLSTNQYGRDDDSGELIYAWCFLSGNRETGPFWSLLTFTLFLFVSVLLVAYFLLRIFYRYGSMNMRTEYPEIYQIVISMALYPAGFFFTWSPNLIFSIILNFGGVNESSTRINLIFNALAILATQSGTVLAIAFFWNCPEARRRWWRYVSSHFGALDSAGLLSDLAVTYPNPINAEEFETQSMGLSRFTDDRGQSSAAKSDSMTSRASSMKQSYDNNGAVGDTYRSLEEDKRKPTQPVPDKPVFRSPSILSPTEPL